jgi:hypothetical protein
MKIETEARGKGAVVTAERLCANGNEQACEMLRRLCNDGVRAACRGA